MTRFARAKGSKGSNVRVPESGTSWDVMKQQLQSSQKEAKEADGRKKAEEQRLENYNQFLQQEYKKNVTQSWCEFPKQNGDGITPIIKKKNKKKKKNLPNESADVSNANTSEMPLSETPNAKKGKLKNKIIVTDGEVATEGKPRKKKKNKKSISQVFTDVSNVDTGEMPSSETPNAKKGKMPSSEIPNVKKDKLKKKRKIIETGEKETTEGEPKKKKKKKKPLSRVSNDVSNVDTEERSSNESDSKKSKRKEKRKVHERDGTVMKKKKKASVENAVSEDPTESIMRGAGLKTPEGDASPWVRFRSVKELEDAVAVKPKKISGKNKSGEGGDSVRRKPLEEKSFSIVVGGEEMEVARLDGFPVLAKDALRLEELRRSMRSKGIPRSEVSRTMQLERRRAEKSLARLKRVVCFNCRKGGHLLAECPELGEDTGMPSTGLCFKCGSTEHNSYDCKVQKGDDFKFSKCFICKERGHIARQCPDHPKGLYPKGGACKLCGDVTHFKKDCPTEVEQKQDDKIKLETIQDGILEEIESKPIVEAKKEKKTKLVKF